MIVALLLCVVFVITLLSCVSDVRALHIPNWHSIVIVGAFAAAYALSPDSFGKWWVHLGGLGFFFIVTYLMFIAGMMGGGDSKLGSALALWVGLKGIVVYVFWMALLGGIIGAFSLWMKKKKPFKSPPAGSWMATVQEGGNGIPYGVAISFGAWMALLHTGIITHQLDELFKIIH